MRKCEWQICVLPLQIRMMLVLANISVCRERRRRSNGEHHHDQHGHLEDDLVAAHLGQRCAGGGGLEHAVEAAQAERSGNEKQAQREKE